MYPPGSLYSASCPFISAGILFARAFVAKEKQTFSFEDGRFKSREYPTAFHFFALYLQIYIRHE
jgi:hypothetical protein